MKTLLPSYRKYGSTATDTRRVAASRGPNPTGGGTTLPKCSYSYDNPYAARSDDPISTSGPLQDVSRSGKSVPKTLPRSAWSTTIRHSHFRPATTHHGRTPVSIGELIVAIFVEAPTFLHPTAPYNMARTTHGVTEERDEKKNRRGRLNQRVRAVLRFYGERDVTDRTAHREGANECSNPSPGWGHAFNALAKNSKP